MTHFCSMPYQTTDGENSTTNTVTRNRSWTGQQSICWPNPRLHEAIHSSQNYFSRFFRKYSISFNHLYTLLKPQKLLQQTLDVQLHVNEKDNERPSSCSWPGQERMHMWNLYVHAYLHAFCTKILTCSKRHANDTLIVRSISFKGKLQCGSLKRRNMTLNESLIQTITRKAYFFTCREPTFF